VNCGGPETDAGREREESVSTSAELLPQSDKNGCKAEQGALPELNAEHPAPGQAEISNGPAFDTANNPTGEEEDEEVHYFSDKE
jgi:hypothetical protein